MIFNRIKKKLGAGISSRYYVLMFVFLSVNLISKDSDQLIAHFTPALKQRFIDTYGKDSGELLDDWLRLITENESEDNWKKLRLVNHFFNKNIQFVDDIDHWGKADYWATPVEFIGTQGGDCEDFALAKYFTLKALGVAPETMRLMYVRALKINQPHMVLIYSETIDQMPLVLDNINKKILPANKRRDLKPIYSFNGDGLWLAKAKGLGKQIKNKGGVARWGDIVSRIETDDFKTNRN